MTKAITSVKASSAQGAGEDDSSKVDLLAPLADKTACAANNVLSGNLAWEILCIGLKKERLYEMQMHRFADEASDIQKTIRQLIDLNSKLLIGDKQTVLSDEAMAQFRELEKSGIVLLEKNEKKLSPERMAELKAQIGSHNDRLKTELHNKFSTKIQVTINETNSLLDTLRMTIKYNDRLITTIIGNQRSQ